MEPQTFWEDGQTSHLASHTCLMLLLPYLAMPKRQIFCLKEKSNKAFPSSQPSFLQCVCSSSAPLLLTGFSVWFCFLSGPCWAESRRLMSLSLSRIRAMWSQWASLSASPAFKASEFGWIETPPEGFCIEAGTKKKRSSDHNTWQTQDKKSERDEYGSLWSWLLSQALFRHSHTVGIKIHTRNALIISRLEVYQ